MTNPEFKYIVITEHVFDAILIEDRRCVVLNYYAGYDLLNTNVAVFQSKKERDDWVRDEGILHRIALSEFIVKQLCNEPFELHNDEIEDNLKWIYNRINLS